MLHTWHSGEGSRGQSRGGRGNISCELKFGPVLRMDAPCCPLFSCGVYARGLHNDFPFLSFEGQTSRTCQPLWHEPVMGNNAGSLLMPVL